MAQKKYYVVWQGRAPGIYETWEECRQQTDGFPGARFRGYADLATATEAFRGDPDQEMGLFRALSQQSRRPPVAVDAIRHDALAVDAGCSGNPGPVEYRGVWVATGKEAFRVGPLPQGSNNIGEYLAIVHAAAMLDARSDHQTPIYTDSRTALAWIRRGAHASKVAPTAQNATTMDLLARADAWLRTHGPIPNPILKWETEQWGEIPADFGRK